MKKKAGLKGEDAKKKFEIFARGVERLKELERELNSLDTRGFYREEQSIRAKLKNVSDIPQIERELKLLKMKIRGRYRPARRKRGRAVEKEIVEIRKGIPEIKKELRRLSGLVVKGRTEDILKMERDIRGLSQMVAEAGRRKVCSPYDIAKIEKEIRGLDRKISELSRKKRAKLDTGVDLLVDADFSEFLTDIKSALSERVRRREKEVDEVLKADLQGHEEKFREKYANLASDFNIRKRQTENELSRKYQAKVKAELRKEVSEKFNEKLRRKLDAEKAELGKRYKEQLGEHAAAQLEREKRALGEKLRRELARQAAALRREEEKEVKALETERKRVEEEKTEEKAKLRKKMEGIEKTRERLEQMKGAELERFEEEKAAERKKEMVVLEAKKKRLEEERGRVEKTRERLEQRKKAEMAKIKERIVDESHRAVQDEIAKREQTLREQMRNEFEAKLKKKIQEHEEGLKRRKLELELELQEKVKKVLE